MTPRHDIVAIRDTATVGDVRALFREQNTAVPVFKDSLDNIAGFICVKDWSAQQRRRRPPISGCSGRRWSCPKPSACPSC